MTTYDLVNWLCYFIWPLDNLWPYWLILLVCRTTRSLSPFPQIFSLLHQISGYLSFFLSSPTFYITAFGNNLHTVCVIYYSIGLVVLTNVFSDNLAISTDSPFHNALLIFSVQYTEYGYSVYSTLNTGRKLCNLLYIQFPCMNFPLVQDAWPLPAELEDSQSGPGQSEYLQQIYIFFLLLF